LARVVTGEVVELAVLFILGLELTVLITAETYLSFSDPPGEIIIPSKTDEMAVFMMAVL
jgi:hypothetical protein